MNTDRRDNYPPRILVRHQRTADVLRDVRYRLTGLPDIALYGPCGVVAVAARTAAIPAAKIAMERGAKHRPEWQPATLPDATAQLLAATVAMLADTARRSAVSTTGLAERLHRLEPAPRTPAATIRWHDTDTYPAVLWIASCIDGLAMAEPSPLPPPTPAVLISRIAAITDCCALLLHSAQPAVEDAFDAAKHAAYLAWRSQ